MLLKTDDLGVVRFNNRNLMDMIYHGHMDKCHVVLCDPSDEVDKFNARAEEIGLDPLMKYVVIDVDQKTFDGVCQGEWYMPDKYKKINLEDYLWDKLLKRESAEYPRMIDELTEFHRRGMHDLLRYMIYLVDFMRENDIVWGVGRGSSVASYILFLIGIHRIDSIKHGLDWQEFLR
jgi:DNA polymerase III alpha subunit